MEMLIGKNRPELLALAQNLNLTIDEQFQLATYPDSWQSRAVHDPSIAMILAENPYLDEQTQQILFSKNVIVRRNLAKNLYVCESIQLQLVDYAIEHGGVENMVIWALAKNSSITRMIQWKLLEYPFKRIAQKRYLYRRLMRNPNISPDIFLIMKNSLPKEFLDKFIMDIEAKKDIEVRKDFEVRKGIEAKKEAEMNERFEKDEYLESSKKDLELDTTLPIEEQWQLFYSGCRDEHIRLAKIKNLLEEIQCELLEKNDDLIISFLADNPYLCDDVKESIFQLRLIYL